MKVALIGLGTAGQTLHLPALARIRGVEVAGACDVEASRRAAVETRWGIPTFEDPDAMLAATYPDVVVIGTPPDSHADLCLRALAAGAHVICEKPFVASLEEADRVLEAAIRAGRRVALNHEFREMPVFRALRAQIGRPDVGELVFAQVWQLMDLPPWKESGWRGQLLQRTLYEAGVHLVDFLMALFGEKPVSVSATTSTCAAHEGDTDAVALVTLEFSRGRLAQVIQDRLCRGETHYFEVRADTTQASLRASFGGRARLSLGLFRSTRPHVRFEYGISGVAWREVGNRRIPLARNPRNPGVVATREIFERTLRAFRDGGRAPVSGEDGRAVLEVLAACYASAMTGRRIRLDREQPLLSGLTLGHRSGTPAPSMT